MTEASPTLRIAALISGGGSTLRNLLDRIADGRLRGVEVVGVVASRDCPGLQHAADFKLPGVVVPRIAEGGDPEGYDAAEHSARITAVLEQWQPELIVCAGYLSLYLPPAQWRQRVVNVHPALLPAFGGPGMYGVHVHEAVLTSGSKVSGCTVHLTDEHYDSGPILAQRSVVVLPDDTVETLAARVQAAERELLPLLLQTWADRRIHVGEDGRVSIDQRVLVELT